MPRVPLLTALALALALAGCGGSDADDRAAPGPAPRTQENRTPTPPPGSPLALPGGIPLQATGPSPPGSVGVVRAWTEAVRAGDLRAAGRLFAPRARVQNGTPVFVLGTRAAAVRWNAGLPCGARVVRAGGARGFVIVEFVLTDRRGADCGAGIGGRARSAVRVRGGRIAEWYRLPDPAGPPRAEAQES